MTTHFDMSWNGRPVVVTGAGGFVGSHLVERLVELGADVTALVRIDARNDDGLIGCLPVGLDAVRIVRGDVTDREAMATLICGAEVVFHLAALTGIPHSYLHPNEVVAVNTTGTLNVLVAARDAGVHKLVVMSTSAVYGKAQYLPIDEQHPKQPGSPYAASKISADAMALSFHNAFELPVAIARPFNTYGPRQSDRAIIPSIIAQALEDGHVEIGNTAPTRDFTFVGDTVNGLVKIAESPRSIGREINLGTGREISIGDLAQRIASTLGIELRLAATESRMRPAETEFDRIAADGRLARELVGWEPRVGLEEGLAATGEWMRGNLDRFYADTPARRRRQRVRAVVLVGGLGKRLRPFTFSVPKPLLPVGDTPVLELLIRSLAQSGIRNLILATGYQAELIRAFCGDGSRFGVDISYVHEREPLGTAGPLALLRDRVSDDELLVVLNGDIITRLDFQKLVDFATANPFDLTIGYTTYVYQSPFGVLNVQDGEVVEIVEKPTIEHSISAGIYAVRPAALDLIPADGSTFTIPQLADELLARGRSVGAFHIPDFWLGMEHMESFDQAIRELGTTPVSGALLG